jgi:16S rRNA (cytidine1402-2'-O)-methyltransferase
VSAVPSSGRLFLVPMPLGPDSDPKSLLPAATIEAAASLRHFVAENARTARRFLARLPLAVPIQQVQFAELNEHTPADALPALLAPLLAGSDVGLVSEAGCPAVADPGAGLVALAHERGIPVVPLVGPSSILLALMASGLNGQAFTFHGYLPVESGARTMRIRELERASAASGATQLFIETPYRAEAMFVALLAAADPSTRLSVAIELTLPQASIVTRTVGEWRRQSAPALASRPAVFALLAAPRVSARAARKPRRT